MKKYLLVFILLISSMIASAKPNIYLFIDGDSAQSHIKQLNHQQIHGAQIIYSWKQLEPVKDHYNFSAIKHDLRVLKSIHKKLFIQIQDKSFNLNAVPVPDYLLSSKYDGGIAKQVDFAGQGKPVGAGWVAKQWLAPVRIRFQKLLRALSKKFDGKIAGINLTETAIDIQQSKYKYFTCDAYFNSTLENMSALRRAFKRSFVIQYVNFFPCEWNNDHNYMSRLFHYARKNNIGLGGPDAIPYRRGQMKNSYPFFHKLHKKMPIVAFAIQEPDYTYTNPNTGKHYSIKQLYQFAANYLGAKVIFWNTQQPQFKNDVLPFLKSQRKDKG
jgi:hypothetical protein